VINKEKAKAARGTSLAADESDRVLHLEEKDGVTTNCMREKKEACNCWMKGTAEGGLFNET